MNGNANSRLRCLIVDDEPVAAEGIALYVSRTDFLEVSAIRYSAIEAEEFLKHGSADLLFLDINMPGMTGIEWLEKDGILPLTILTTAYPDYALDSYRLDVVDYLLKPVSFERFLQAAEKARSRHLAAVQNKEVPDTLMIKQDDTWLRISTEDILYVEGMQNYLKLHLTSGSAIIRKTMNSFASGLPSGQFFRTHKSYLVNMAHIEGISGSEVLIAGQRLPLSPLKKRDLLKTLAAR